MLKRVFFIAFLLIFCSSFIPAQVQNSDQESKKESNKNLISPIVLIPGLKQLTNQKYLKGSLFLGCFAISVTGALINNHHGYGYYNQYLEATDIQNITLFKDNSKAAFKRRNLFLIGAFSIWLFHLIDLKIFNKRSKIKSEINLVNSGFGLHFSF